MTLKKRGCIEKDHKDIYCIEGDVNILREKIKRKFIDAEKSETFHFGDVNREEILLRKLLNHNQSKKAFIEDHLVKMKVLIQRIITLEKENEKCTSVAQENKHLKQEVKYWKNHVQEAERISSYSMKRDSYIQELEKRVYMLKEELLEAFKREYKLKKDISSQKTKGLKYGTTNFDDTFLRDLLEERKSCLRGKAMEMENKSIKRFIYSDKISNVDKFDEQVSSSNKREYKTRKKFPASRSKESSDSYISLMKRLDNRDMISKECRQGGQEEEEQMIMGYKMQRLISENQEIQLTLSKLQIKSPIDPKKSTEYTDEEESDEGKSDGEDSDEACEQELEGKINSHGGNRLELSKVWENLSVLEKPSPRKEHLHLEGHEKMRSKNEVASRDKGELEQNYVSSKTVMGGKEVGIGITAMQESNRQLLGRTRISREISDGLKEEMLLQRRPTSDERAFKERTAVTKDNKFYSERNEAEELYLSSDSTESLPINFNYEMRERIDGKDRHQSFHERFHASPERYKEFKSVESKDGESSMTERRAECQDKYANSKPTTDELSLPLKEIRSFSNCKKSEKEKYVPQKAEKAKQISSKIEAPLEENQSRAKEKQYEVKEKQLFPDDTTSKSKERYVVSKEKLILPDNTADPSKGRENMLVEDKERVVGLAKEIHIIVKEKEVIPEDAASQSKDRGSTEDFPGSTNTQTKGRENITKDIQAEDIALQSNKRDTIDKKMEVLQDTQAKEMISEEIQIAPEKKEMISEEIQVLLDDKEMISEEIQAISEYKEMISEEIQAVPEKNEMISEEIQVLLDDKKMISEEIQAMPEVKEMISEEIQARPEEKEIISEEIQTVQEDIETQYNKGNTLAKEMKIFLDIQAKEMISEEIQAIPEDITPQSIKTDTNGKEIKVLQPTQGKVMISEEIQAVPEEKEMITEEIQTVLEDIETQYNKGNTLAKEMKIFLDIQAKEMISEEIQAIPEDITPQSIKTDTNGKEIKVLQPTQGKEMISEEIQAVPEEKEMISEEIQTVQEDIETQYNKGNTLAKEIKIFLDMQAKEMISEEIQAIPEDITPQSIKTDTNGKEIKVLQPTQGKVMISEEIQAVPEEKEMISEEIQTVLEDIETQSNKRDTMAKEMKILLVTQAKEMPSEEIQVVPEDIPPQYNKGNTIAKEIKIILDTQAKEMISEEIPSFPEETTTLSKERKTMFKQMQAHSDDIATQCTERETMLEEMKVLPTKSITQSKERAKIQAASEEKTTQSTEKKTMFEQLQHIPEDTETQSNASEILFNSKQAPHGDRTQFKGIDFLTDVMQAQPKETIVASKWSEFNQKSVPKEKEFNFEENAGTSTESTFINGKPVEEKFEMMKKERELMLKDAIAEGKFVLSGLGTVPGKPKKEKWPQLMNRNEMENLLTKEVFDKPAKDKPEMLREVKEHKTNHFPYRENVTIPSRRETVRKQTKETQPLGMDRSCRCKKENYFLEQVLNFQETTQKTNIKENVIRTEVSKIISLKYKKEDIALNRQPRQETIHNTRIHDLIHMTGRKECGQTFSFTNKIYKEKHEAGLRENTVDDNYLHASILQYQNELQEVEQETDQLINIVQDLLGALGTSFKLLKEDKMREHMN